MKSITTLLNFSASSMYSQWLDASKKTFAQSGISWPTVAQPSGGKTPLVLPMQFRHSISISGSTGRQSSFEEETQKKKSRVSTTREIRGHRGLRCRAQSLTAGRRPTMQASQMTRSHRQHKGTGGLHITNSILYYGTPNCKADPQNDREEGQEDISTTLSPGALSISVSKIMALVPVAFTG